MEDQYRAFDINNNNNHHNNNNNNNNTALYARIYRKSFYILIGA
jgi:hypothetical protein